MDGLNYGTDTHRHGELHGVLAAYLDVIIRNPNRQLSTAWQRGFKSILDAYLGECPETFTVNGKEYNPHTYVESLGINLDDYIDVTSWTHKPFYEKMIIEVPDNWLWESSMNVPIDDLVAIIDNALENGYSVAWAADVSEKGFATKTTGVAVIPAETAREMSGAEIAKWENTEHLLAEKDAFKKAVQPLIDEKVSTDSAKKLYEAVQKSRDL